MIHKSNIFHFFSFQDKIRLLQDDLEIERELRQRVSINIRQLIRLSNLIQVPPNILTINSININTIDLIPIFQCNLHLIVIVDIIITSLRPLFEPTAKIN